jgi:hypothetical protein
MFFRKIFLSIHLGFLSVYFSVISIAASITKNKGSLQRAKILIGIAIIAVSSTLSGCFVKPKHTCYSPVPADTTRNVRCYDRAAAVDTTKNQDQPKDAKKNQKNDKDKPPMCYMKSK